MRNRLILTGILSMGGILGMTATADTSMAAAQNESTASMTADSKNYVKEALKHAQEADSAGKQGKADALVKHAEMALSKAKDAQRAGHNERLNEGVYALGDAIEHGRKGETKDAREHIMHAIMKLSEAAGLQGPEQGNMAGSH